MTLSVSTSSGNTGNALLQVLTDATAALASLDAESLELLQMRALQVEGEHPGPAELSDPMLADLAARRRIFAEVLRSTGEHLNLLKRMSGRGAEGVWDH